MAGSVHAGHVILRSIGKLVIVVVVVRRGRLSFAGLWRSTKAARFKLKELIVIVPIIDQGFIYTRRWIASLPMIAGIARADDRSVRQRCRS
jgi:hypothetical protein